MIDDYNDQLSYSEDPDARIGYKSQDHSFHGYKTYLAMSDEPVITAAVITSGEKEDGQYLSKKWKNRNGSWYGYWGPAYSGTDNLNYVKGKYNLISKLHQIIEMDLKKEEEQ